MKVGDQVLVLDDAISGVILAIKDKEITIETEEGFPMNFMENELVVVGDELQEKELFRGDVSQIISEKEEHKHTASKRVKPKERTLPPMVVDLHIQQLVTKTKGMANHDMLTIQIDTAKRQLDFAIRKRIPKVVFIHGVGEGVLRIELEYLFKRYDNIQFYDADFQKYGRGATEIYIFQNPPSEG